MQTFITESGPGYGVHNLDSKRLNKQLLEGRQIMNILITLRGDSSAKVAWRNHPAVLMWVDNEAALFRYCISVVLEMISRGIAFDKNLTAINALMDSIDWANESQDVPDWATDPVALDKIITTHRASLYNKDPEHYAQWKFEAEWVDKHREAAVCCTRCNYYWPTHKETK